MLSVTPSQYQLLAKLLDAAELRQKAIAHNIANVNTPGYKRLDVKFEQDLRRAIEQGDDGQLASIDPKIIVDTTATERLDGNNVDIDRELGLLTRNELLYNVGIQVLAAKLAMMRTAITGR